MVQFSQLQKPSQATLQGSQVDPNLLAMIMAQKDKKSQGLGSMLGQYGPQIAEMGLKMANRDNLTEGNAYGGDIGGFGAAGTRGINATNPAGVNQQDFAKKRGTASKVAGAGAGAVSGAAMGAPLGPIGIGVGALLGGLKGYFG